MKRILLFYFISASLINAQNFSGGFNFNLPWNDSTTQKFLPQFPKIKIQDNAFVSSDINGNFISGGNKIRFWGVNCVSDGAFPQKEKAGLIAGRMRKLGINLVRFHHIDNPWSTYSLLTGVDTRILNSANLDLLDYFISKLREEGIYINMNLNVSRTFTSYDGVADADSIKKYGTDFFKTVTLFDPYLIQLQREYAQQLLTHINSYTGKSLVNDPIMAMVETNNENSLYRAWRDNILKPIISGGKLVKRHVQMLDSLWIAFLKNKYISTSAIRTAWNIGTSPFGQTEQIKNSGFEDANINVNWEIEQNGGSKAILEKDNFVSYEGISSAKVTVTLSTGTDWHVQFKQKTLTIKKDSSYTVTFVAKSDVDREITVSVMNDLSPWTWYNGKTIVLTTSWKTYSFSFRSPTDNLNHTRLSFSLGKNKSTYWFDKVSFTKAGTAGLNIGESLEAKNITRIDYSDCTSYSDQRVKDISEFYIQLQQKYFKDIFSFLKNSLGVKVPIVGTNWNIGAADLASTMVGDYVDNHSYWDHPQFPQIPWSSTDWFINNNPMVKNIDGGTIPGLFAGVPMTNKPYTISEYNHPFPNRYQSEALIFLTAYSLFNKADGIMVFEYNNSRDYESDWINSYFSVNRNSVFMTQFPTLSYVFRNSLIKESINPIKINYKPETLYLLPKNYNTGWHETIPYDRKLTLRNSIQTESYDSNLETNFKELPSSPSNPYVTDTNEIIWNTSDGTIEVTTEKFISAAGYLSMLKNKRMGDLQITDLQNDDFGMLSWLSLTNEKLSSSSFSLLTLASKIQNIGMVWNSNNNSINNNWGKNPTVIFPLRIRLDLNIYADSIKVYPLNNMGQANYITPFVIKPIVKNYFSVELDQNVYKTLWFSIEKFGYGDPTSVRGNGEFPAKFDLEQNYPNPFNPSTVICYHLAADSFVTLKVYDILGREVSTLINEYQSAGTYNSTLNFQLISAGKQILNLSSGVYIYKLTAGNFSAARKMLLLK